MKRTPLNTGWEFRPKAGRLAERAGRALAVVRSTGPGEITVTVSAADRETTTVTLNAS